MSKRIKRPSPAMVVAGAALIVAVAGTATAAPTAVQSVLKKQDKKKIKKIAANKANQAIDRRAPGLSVASANTANAANTANSAGNADTVDGRHATCPGGYVAVAGTCYGASSRLAASWIAASDDCVDENASLPTVGQLRLAVDELGNVNDTAGEWTDSLHLDDAAFRANTVVGDVTKTVGNATIGNTRAYRCVTPLVR